MARLPAWSWSRTAFRTFRLVTLPQPRRELGRIVTVEVGDLLVDGKTCLLHEVRRVDAGRRPVVEQVLGKVTQVPTIILNSSPNAAWSPVRARAEFANDGVGFHLAFAVV